MLADLKRQKTRYLSCLPQETATIEGADRSNKSQNGTEQQRTLISHNCRQTNIIEFFHNLNLNRRGESETETQCRDNENTNNQNKQPA